MEDKKQVPGRNGWKVQSSSMRMDHLFNLCDLQCQHVRVVRIQAPLTFQLFTQDLAFQHHSYLPRAPILPFSSSSHHNVETSAFRNADCWKIKDYELLGRYCVCVSEEWEIEANKLFSEAEYIYSCISVCVWVCGREGVVGYLCTTNKIRTKHKTPNQIPSPSSG